jgi:tRNA pseudouridine55 synthase
MDGILLLDKPLGPSSNQALGRVKRLFRTAKAGHTGTLDPLASGMLPCCLGEATKVAGFLIGARKAYEACIALGVATTTADAEGEVCASEPVPEFDTVSLLAVLARFRGRITQRAPVYSAIKRDGVPLYRLARRGVEVEAPEREVEIEAIDLLAHEAQAMSIRVVCGSGTYIRSLAVDIGAALGCPAHLAALRRLWVAPFQHEALIDFDRIEQAAAAGDVALAALLLPMDRALMHLARLDLDTQSAVRLRQGQRLRCAPPAAPGTVRVYAPGGSFLGLAELDAGGSLHARRLLSAS